MPATVEALPEPSRQAERLIELGIHEIGGLPAKELRAAVTEPRDTGTLLVIHPDQAPASALVPLLQRSGKPGFIVVDMPDIDDFSPIEHAALPPAPLYLADDLQRGDEMRNWSPDEALPAITAVGRTPLTVCEGIYCLLQRTDVLARGRCFMTIGSRLRKPNGSLDARTPALWISNGTGRDGRDNRDAPKLGWCWAGNRHTWLGFASASRRVTAMSNADRR